MGPQEVDEEVDEVELGVFFDRGAMQAAGVLHPVVEEGEEVLGGDQLHALLLVYCC